MVDDADAMCHAIGFVHVVRGEKDGDALGFIDTFHMRPELVAALRIEPKRGFVEEENLRRVQKAAGDLETALHAAGEFLHLIVAAIPQFEELEQFFCALATNLAGHVIEHAMDLHVFPGGEVAVEARILKDDAEALTGLVLMGSRIEPVELDRAAWWLQQGSEHFDGGGLPCSVGTEEGEDFSFGNVERDIVDGGKGTEGFDEVMDSESRGTSE